MRSAPRAAAAAARLTRDSRASERRPTDPVSFQARSLRAMVTTAVPSESQA